MVDILHYSFFSSDLFTEKTEMSLDLSVTQTISCEAVVAIAEDAAKAILDVYNSKVGQPLELLFPAKARCFDVFIV